MTSNFLAAEAASWRKIEGTVPFAQLPALHRRFLIWRSVPGASEMNVRRAGQRVEAELNRMVQEGKAQRQGDDWVLAPGALGDFQTQG